MNIKFMNHAENLKQMVKIKKNRCRRSFLEDQPFLSGGLYLEGNNQFMDVKKALNYGEIASLSFPDPSGKQLRLSLYPAGNLFGLIS